MTPSKCMQFNPDSFLPFFLSVGVLSVISKTKIRNSARGGQLRGFFKQYNSNLK